VRVDFYCTLWGSEQLSFEDFLKKAQAEGYTGVELTFPLGESQERDRRVALVAEAGMELIAIHGEVTSADFVGHRRQFDAWIRHLAVTQPAFITTQSGRDMFTFEQNMEILELCDRIQQDTGISIVQETHRSKLTYAAHLTRDYLEARPEMRLTLDVSHWFNVHERYLDDLQDALDLAISRTDHIHARIGHMEGPQVPDWRMPVYKEVVDIHLAIWDRVIERARTEGRDRFTVTPEFGPPPYTHFNPDTGKILADPWVLNAEMKDLLNKRWN
jgi:sugar phosphate isomerase/epimerase